MDITRKQCIYKGQPAGLALACCLVYIKPAMPHALTAAESIHMLG